VTRIDEEEAAAAWIEAVRRLEVESEVEVENKVEEAWASGAAVEPVIEEAWLFFKRRSW
jgi:hypothetical protein